MGQAFAPIPPPFPEDVSEHAGREDENPDELAGVPLEDPLGLDPSSWPDEDEPAEATS